MKSVAVAVFALIGCALIAGCDSQEVSGTAEACNKKAVNVHGPGNDRRTIYACDGQGVAAELDKNCSDSVVDICDVIQSGTETCEWDRVSSSLTAAQFDWVSEEDTGMDIRYVKVENWGCTSN